MSILSAGRKGTFSQALYVRLSLCDVTHTARHVSRQPLPESKPRSYVVVSSYFLSRFSPQDELYHIVRKPRRLGEA
jgi:hypothetical protein